jgi:hypothetical protein
VRHRARPHPRPCADPHAVISVIGIVCEVYHVLGYSCSYSYKYAEVYLEAVDFVSISFALYGLIVFYGLTKEELRGRRPLAKFLSIKLIVMFTFYQSFVVSPGTRLPARGGADGHAVLRA